MKAGFYKNYPLEREEEITQDTGGDGTDEDGEV